MRYSYNFIFFRNQNIALQSKRVFMTAKIILFFSGKTAQKNKRKRVRLRKRNEMNLLSVNKN